MQPVFDGLLFALTCIFVDCSQRQKHQWKSIFRDDKSASSFGSETRRLRSRRQGDGRRQGDRTTTNRSERQQTIQGLQVRVYQRKCLTMFKDVMFRCVHASL